MWVRSYKLHPFWLANFDWLATIYLTALIVKRDTHCNVHVHECTFTLYFQTLNYREKIWAMLDTNSLFCWQTQFCHYSRQGLSTIELSMQHSLQLIVETLGKHRKTTLISKQLIMASILSANATKGCVLTCKARWHTMPVDVTWTTLTLIRWKFASRSCICKPGDDFLWTFNTVRLPHTHFTNTLVVWYVIMSVLVHCHLFVRWHYQTHYYWWWEDKVKDSRHSWRGTV